MNIKDCETVISEPSMADETSGMGCGARLYGAGCRTRLIIDDFYQCQILNPDCGFATPFGTIHLCLSAYRREFSVERWQRENDRFRGLL